VIEKLCAEGFEPLGDKWILLLVVCAADYTAITASTNARALGWARAWGKTRR
jgi:hypothetical protein